MPTEHRLNLVAATQDIKANRVRLMTRNIIDMQINRNMQRAEAAYRNARIFMEDPEMHDMAIAYQQSGHYYFELASQWREDLDRLWE